MSLLYAVLAVVFGTLWLGCLHFFFGAWFCKRVGRPQARLPQGEPYVSEAVCREQLRPTITDDLWREVAR